MTNYKSRKFLLALAALISVTVLMYLKTISDGVYSAVVIAVINGYFAANVAQKATAK